MEALQYIYTSWKNGNSTEKGYMIYSRSEGISDAECAAIKDAMQYQAPKGLPLTPSKEEISRNFPYSFAYFRLPGGRGCVAQSTYLGKDYSGRFGNYIIYALVFDTAKCFCYPAELYGESYIKTFMIEPELNASSPVPPLPALRIVRTGSVINDERLREFLSGRETVFAQMVSLAMAARDAKVPFYLNDTRENMVLWAAAFQRILPRAMAMNFAFNTYAGDHDAMRSAKLREENIDFFLLGVRPDANYFNYVTECRSSRQMVMDIKSGCMTEGIQTEPFALAMARSITGDCREIEMFGNFLERTSLEVFGGRLRDAWTYYRLLKFDEFDCEECLPDTIVEFGMDYGCAADNTEIGGKLLTQIQNAGWTVPAKSFEKLWKFICRNTGFMAYTLYDLLIETIYQSVCELEDSGTDTEELLEKIEKESPSEYKEFLNYQNSNECIEQMILYLAGHPNLYTNRFYIKWLMRSYKFEGGLNNRQPVSKLLRTLFANISRISGNEAAIMEILIKSSSDTAFFESVLTAFQSVLQNADSQDLFCSEYVKMAEQFDEKEISRFENMLFGSAAGMPLAVIFFAYRISKSTKPEETFWKIYEQQSRLMGANSEYNISPMLLAYMKRLSGSGKEKAAARILADISPELLDRPEILSMLLETLENADVKYIEKIENRALKSAYRLARGNEFIKIEKLKAVMVGKMAADSSSGHLRLLNISKELSGFDISLSSLDKSDYETYLKLFLKAYMSISVSADDISIVMKIFDHPRFFQKFAGDYINVLKHLEKKEAKKWQSLMTMTCVYILTAGPQDAAAEKLWKTFSGYLQGADSEKLIILKKQITKETSAEQCRALFEKKRKKRKKRKKKLWEVSLAAFSAENRISERGIYNGY